jgi:hypothetical protein
LTCWPVPFKISLFFHSPLPCTRWHVVELLVNAQFLFFFTLTRWRVSKHDMYIIREALVLLENKLWE